MSYVKYWCYTLNNYTEEDEQKLQEEEFSSYHVYGREVGESGTKHLQGYIEFPSKKRLTWLKKHITAKAHWETRKGNAQQASDYCKKDEDIFEKGAISNPKPGQRTDIMKAKELIDEGKSLHEVADQCFPVFLRYERSLKSYMALKIKPRNFKPEIIVHWGPTETGKTRAIYDNHALEDIWVYNGDRWFDGYIGQPVALFDDFSGSEFKLTYLLRLLDRYPMAVPVKGSFVQFVAKTIYITANTSPDTWYQYAHPEHRAALMRRLDVIKEF